MKKPSLLVALLLVSSIAAAPLPYVQQLQAGNWTGTAQPPDGPLLDLVYEVANTDDGLVITIHIAEMGMALEASEPKLEGNVLRFGLHVEMDVLTCALERQEDGSYRGECIDAGGTPGYLVMNPPGGSAF